MQSEQPVIETDAVVIGAGPVGLFQVFELGLLGIKAHVVDSLPYAGGQCIELYADKPIYDIPALRVCTGRELVAKLLDQISPFHAPLHLDQEVGTVEKQPDGRFFLETRKGARFLATTVFIAGGVGSFQMRPLKIQGIEAFEGTQLFYRVNDAARFAGKRVVVAGGGDEALQWAAALAEPGPHQAARVTLVHRRDVFQADPDLIARCRTLRDAGAIEFMAGQISGAEEAESRLVELSVDTPEGETTQLPLDAVLVFFGVSPKLGPIAEWGLDIERKQLVVDAARFETSAPGIFAVGDVNTYPGKKKLILCGFHEATLAAFAAAEYVFPDKRVLLQYTTTSPALHKALGVETRTPHE